MIKKFVFYFAFLMIELFNSNPVDAHNQQEKQIRKTKFNTSSMSIQTNQSITAER